MNEVIASFRRVRSKGLSARFYEILLASHPEISASFANTDFNKQSELLLHGIFSLLEFSQGKTIGALAIRRLAVSHDHTHLNVKPEWYDSWLDCLILTLQEKDPRFTESLAKQWREALKPGLAQMRQAY